MSATYDGVKKSGLSFKGEDTRTKKKRRHEKEVNKPGEPRLSDDADVAASAGSADVPILEGVGRVVTNTTTVHGFESKFKEQLEPGDTLMIHHPVSLEVEMRLVVSVLSQRSCVLHSAFSKDIASTTEYHIRKDSLKLKEKAKAQVEASAAEVDEPVDSEALQDATSRELQKQMERQMKKQKKTVHVREKTGMWGYKVVTKTLGKSASAEDMLDERCKQGRDKYCF